MLTSSKGNLEISLKSPTFPTCMYIIHQTEETGWEKERKENITELKMPKKKTKKKKKENACNVYIFCLKSLYLFWLKLLSESISFLHLRTSWNVRAKNESNSWLIFFKTRQYKMILHCLLRPRASPI